MPNRKTKSLLPSLFPQKFTLLKEKNAEVLDKIFKILRVRTGHDFSDYRPNTLLRRIERRIAITQTNTAEAYLEHIEKSYFEATTLFRDLLIGVTHFFRDPYAFAALQKYLYALLLAKKTDEDTIRIWVPGCSSGEEAYSIAILLQEGMEYLKKDIRVQIFATDIDTDSITKARAGVYLNHISKEITADRLSRFFTLDPVSNTYKINRNIREMLIFSGQSVTKDPPFSRLDLISCRNLMIYFNLELQKSVLAIFHYALRPGGLLFLGCSEGVNKLSSQYFSAADKSAKIYQRIELSHTLFTKIAKFTQIIPSKDKDFTSRNTMRNKLLTKSFLREIVEQTLLNNFVGVGILVNEKGDILYSHGCSDAFLKLPSGDAITNAFKLEHEGLLPNLSTTFHKAVTKQEIASSQGITIKTDGHFTTVNLTIHPMSIDIFKEPKTPLYLIILEEILPHTLAQARVPTLSTQTDSEYSDNNLKTEFANLKDELRTKEEYLRNVIAELERSTLEITAYNEEIQAVNEELQSTNEELETSKEEMQSVNQELSTINVELQSKVAELARANNDMNNLLAGTGIGTIFVDFNMRILRFTPDACLFINLIKCDVGRPVAHLVCNLVGYDQLTQDIQKVLDTLVPKEVNVQSADGKWYKLRIQPYRTLDNTIEGAVISFLDLTEILKNHPR